MYGKVLHRETAPMGAPGDARNQRQTADRPSTARQEAKPFIIIIRIIIIILRIIIISTAIAIVIVIIISFLIIVVAIIIGPLNT